MRDSINFTRNIINILNHIHIHASFAMYNVIEDNYGGVVYRALQQTVRDGKCIEHLYAKSQFNA